MLRDRLLFMAGGEHRREMFFLINVVIPTILSNLKYQLKNKYPPWPPKDTIQLSHAHVL
jgi:hypothetical protein